MTGKEVFRKFFQRRERLIGNPEDSELAEEMSAFFYNLFSKEIIEYSDLDVEKCIQIM